MGLTIITETMESIAKHTHSFTDVEKEFVVQFAFRTNDTAATNQLIDELAACEDGQSGAVMEKYAEHYDAKPAWVTQFENLLVSIEMYRIEEEKALCRLTEVLTAYGVDVTEEQIRRAEAEESNKAVSEHSRQKEAEEEREDAEEKEEEHVPNCTLRNMTV